VERDFFWKVPTPPLKEFVGTPTTPLKRGVGIV